MSPSFPGSPNRKPETKTPIKSSGSICFVKVHVSLNHFLFHLFQLYKRIDNPIIPAINGITGLYGKIKARTVHITPTITLSTNEYHTKWIG
jgi:hypothetical protein